MLKDLIGNWTRDQEQLKRMTYDYFRERYTSIGHQQFTPLLQYCSCHVKEETNLKLIEDVTLEEVKQATFQLGTSKAPNLDGLNGQFFQHH